MGDSAGTPPGSGLLCPRCAAAGSSANKSSSIPWKAIAIGAGVTVGAAVTAGAAAVLAAPLALSALGFSAAGVAAGSTAAAIQSTMGGVIVKGSLFALCQSWGAVGLTATANGVLGATGAGVGGTAGALAAFFKRKKQAKKPSGDGEPEEEPRVKPDGAGEKELKEKQREEAARESDGEVEKEEKSEAVLQVCPVCGAIIPV